MNILRKIAPFISQGLGMTGPIGAMAGQVLTAALGVKKGSTDDQLAAALQNATPDQIAAIKKAENDFQVQMKQLEITSIEDMRKLDEEDRASARTRESDLAKAGAKDNTPKVLAYLMAAMATAVSILMLSGKATVMQNPTQAAMAG